MNWTARSVNSGVCFRVEGLIGSVQSGLFERFLD